MGLVLGLWRIQGGFTKSAEHLSRGLNNYEYSDARFLLYLYLEGQGSQPVAIRRSLSRF